jgi:hypothetical protein
MAEKSYVSESPLTPQGRQWRRIQAGQHVDVQKSDSDPENSW